MVMMREWKKQESSPIVLMVKVLLDRDGDGWSGDTQERNTFGFTKTCVLF